MKHEQPDHFVENDIRQTLKTAREDQIKRLLQDIGFIPNAKDDETMRKPHD
ncbi:hypothetical protein ROLI_040930 [Roseobacter fucihabitans]|uniref:Uncharacterized protein n=1 Tax=Roseobacter fucihabitans TaxID=1537242 RepID=A0ABZ2BY30_9RHOB|nr:hypothetical protein [Roseobacter litoralis]MBC6965870.1 hypothetical protein [Roseobacter litoralis]